MVSQACGVDLRPPIFQCDLTSSHPWVPQQGRVLTFRLLRQGAQPPLQQEASVAPHTRGAAAKRIQGHSADDQGQLQEQLRGTWYINANLREEQCVMAGTVAAMSAP